MACNSAVLRPTNKCFLPSCSSRDSASNEIVFIIQSLKMAARACQTANNSDEQRPCFIRIASLSYPSQGKTLYIE